MRLASLGVLALLASSVAAAEHKYLKAFPAAEEGMKRCVILLTDKERGEDDNFKVELIVGREILTDGVNRYMLGGKIEAMLLQGWGFTYYEVKSLGGAASTRIGVPPGKPQVKKFVDGPSTIIRYNSRIPLIVYVPEDAEVRYRIWSTANETKTAEER